MNKTLDTSIFLQEWLASNRMTNQLPISAACNSHCLFCSNRSNPFHVATGVFRDLEDVKLQLGAMPRHEQAIRMSDSLPGRIAEGEAFLHPKFFDILELVRGKYLANPLCFTTNGSMLDEPFANQLARFRPIELTISMHSRRLDVWAHVFGMTQKESHCEQSIWPVSIAWMSWGQSCRCPRCAAGKTSSGPTPTSPTRARRE
jgi:hypothetical protein